MKRKRVSVIILILILILSCGKDEPLEPPSYRRERERTEKYKPACFGIIALYNGSCGNSSDKINNGKYCQELYTNCTYICMFAGPSTWGCGF